MTNSIQKSDLNFDIRCVIIDPKTHPRKYCNIFVFQDVLTWHIHMSVS